MSGVEKLGFSREEVARMTGLSLDTVRRAIAKGDLRAKRTSVNAAGDPSGKYVVTKRAVEEWLDSLPDA